MKYQIKMVYDQSDVSALVRALDYRRHPEKGIRTARRIGYPIFGILLILAGIALPASGMLSLAEIFLTVFCILMGILLLRRSDRRGMERRSWKQYPNKGLTLTYTFFNDHFEEEDEVSGKNEFKYITLKNGNLDEGHFFLFTNGNMAHMLRRDSFTFGDPDTFANFIKIRAAVTLDPVE